MHCFSCDIEPLSYIIFNSEGLKMFYVEIRILA